MNALTRRRRLLVGGRVYVGRRSVGNNILDGVPAVFAAHGVQAPPIGQRRTAPDATGGSLAAVARATSG
ncbi:hypothetical protein GCM10009557_04510 [Virgisporangium ochraceum]|uniref:Uncharacterized protein n=1 Tax=Virgisporangium ochraceum TaxID=65505 RepID=A0A8J4EBC7_9ACTN|nr:hypothetical protein [Virgisporangium ochraceum]GIJ65697.1 hypothetical protein Voc01_006140 [Virgisporangium ochraceum]